MRRRDSREGRVGDWARHATIVTLSVVGTVVSALIASIESWLVLGLALVVLIVAVAGAHWLQVVAGARPAAVQPDGTRGTPHPSAPPRRSATQKATCAVIARSGRRTTTSTGTLVADGLVVTAARVVQGARQVTVQFTGRAGTELAAERLKLGDDAAPLGVALLGLRATSSTPDPAGLWPARRLPTEVDVLVPVSSTGGPGPRGVWRAARLAGVVDDGPVHLVWEVGAPPAGPGGGPVCDRETGLFVGILVDDPPTGRLDRMVTVDDLRRAGAGLPRPWLLAGDSARAHFLQRAGGQHSVLRGGDLFRGRSMALETVDRWMRTAVCPKVPLVVTGQPGAGKSAVVGRALLRAERAGHSDGLGFHARQATVGDLVDGLAAVCGIDPPASWRDLAQDLGGFTPASPLVVVVDALDEAVHNDIPELRQMLRYVARLDWARVVVATRPRARSDRYRRGGHLHSLGVDRGAASRNLVDLDDDRFHAPGELRGYAADQLAQRGVAHPGPPGAAWETYRRDIELRDRLAGLVADRAGRNYLVAGMSASHLSEKDVVLDPASPGFDPTDVPSGVDEALTMYLESLPPGWQRRVEDLLAALAYGRGSGLDDRRWLTFAGVLGSEGATRADLDDLRASAVDYLLETTPDEGGDRVTRLFHQALADELVARRSGRADERRLVASFRAESPTGSWLDVSSYARRHAPEHAAAAGILHELLDETDFLVGMSPEGMRTALAGVTIRSRADQAAIYHVALPFLHDGDGPEDRGANAVVLDYVSRIQGNPTLADRLAELDVDRPWHVVGAIRHFDTDLARFDSHTDNVVNVASLDWPGLDHWVLVTTSLDGTTRVWDPFHPDTDLARFDGHPAGAQGVTSLDWPGHDHQVVVTTSDDGTARVWDPQGPEEELARFDGHTGPVFGVISLAWPGLDHPVLVTTSLDGTARVWDPQRPEEELARFEQHTNLVGAVASLEWPGVHHPVVVTTSFDGTARVWDPRRPEEVLARFEHHASWVTGVASIDWPGLDHQVVVTGSTDGSARIWDPLQPDEELARFDRHTNYVVGVAAVDWPGLDHTAVATTSVDGTARVWDPLRPDTELARFDGHTGPTIGISALDWPHLDHPVLVTTSFDGTARIWDPRAPDTDLTQHNTRISEVWNLSTLSWPGLDHPVLVTTSFDGTARVWDPRRPEEDLARFEGHTTWVTSAASIDWPGLDHQVVVTTANDGTARVWDPLRPNRELAHIKGHDDLLLTNVTPLGWPGLDHSAIVTTSHDATARVWDPLRPSEELACFDGHTDWVNDATALTWPGLDHPVVVTVSTDSTARIWDPLRPSEELARFTRHAAWVWCATTLDWPGLDHPVVVTTSHDRTARVWDPLRPDEELARFDGHTDRVWGATTLEWPGLDHPAVVTTSFDRTARIWDPQQPETELARLPIFGSGYSVTVIGPRHLAVGTNRGCVMLRID